ncbi:MAG: 50S ribosomal protein L4 [Candidatus Omnitrophica bacterium]|nr:50S ribosomal protein L4 [Candidatus Omnitrophota bacterium]
MDIKIHTLTSKTSENIKLDDKVFGGEVNKAVLYQVINMYSACQRQGNASTKRRGEVRGGGKKPWKQKGTGRARFGSSRNPVWRSGGVTFGPKPREFRYSVPTKARRQAFIASLRAKLADNDLIVVDQIKLDEPKTKKLVAVLKRLKVKDGVLLVDRTPDINLCRAAGNLPDVTLRASSDCNCLDILKRTKLVLTKRALEDIVKRVNK